MSNGPVVNYVRPDFSAAGYEGFSGTLRNHYVTKDFTKLTYNKPPTL